MSISPEVWAIIAPVGAVAALCRFSVDGFIKRRSESGFPLGTLVVNLSGAMALGLVHGLGVGGNPALLVGTAGIGTYTTFSTLIFETERLLEDNDRLLAAANLFGSMILGLDAVLLGWWIGTLIH